MSKGESNSAVCKSCGKAFKSYKVKTYGQEVLSAICKDCREKYS